MKSEERKAAVAAYKLRKAVPGIYVVACATTGEQWAGSAPDLATIWNRLSFTLRQGANTHRSLQAAWRRELHLRDRRAGGCRDIALCPRSLSEGSTGALVQVPAGRSDLTTTRRWRTICSARCGCRAWKRPRQRTWRRGGRQQLPRSGAPDPMRLSRHRPIHATARPLARV